MHIYCLNALRWIFGLSIFVLLLLCALFFGKIGASGNMQKMWNWETNAKQKLCTYKWETSDQKFPHSITHYLSVFSIFSLLCVWCIVQYTSGEIICIIAEKKNSITCSQHSLIWAFHTLDKTRTHTHICKLWEDDEWHVMWDRMFKEIREKYLKINVTTNGKPNCSEFHAEAKQHCKWKNIHSRYIFFSCFVLACDRTICSLKRVKCAGSSERWNFSHLLSLFLCIRSLEHLKKVVNSTKFQNGKVKFNCSSFMFIKTIINHSSNIILKTKKLVWWKCLLTTIEQKIKSNENSSLT